MTHTDESFNVQAFLAQFSGQLTDDRQKIAEELAGRLWFQATSPELRAELVTLPQEGAENHDGYLTDLAARPEQLGGIEVLRLHALARGKFALISIFDVRNLAKGHEYTYEYVSWRYGSLPGAKGLVFVRPSPSEPPTHFVVLVGEKFAPSTKVYDTLGGFIDLGVEGVQTLRDRILLEVKQELGVEDLEVSSIIDLGQVYTDHGMTNSKPSSFVAFISSDQAGRIPKETVNSDIHELKAGALVVPIEQLREFVLNNNDALFHVALMRAIASTETDEVFRKSVLNALA
jgi:hypothetical protein